MDERQTSAVKVRTLLLVYLSFCVKKKIKSFWEMRETVNQRGKEGRVSCARGRPLVEEMIIACGFM